MVNVPELKALDYAEVKSFLSEISGVVFGEDCIPSGQHLGYLTVELGREGAIKVVEGLLKRLDFSKSCDPSIEEFTE